MTPFSISPFRFASAIPIGLVFVVVVGFLAGGEPTPRPTTPSRPVDYFATWPQQRKPDAVLVITGQTFGYLQPCGCSRPQLGGLERRFVFIQSLKQKGWPVAGVDLGDIPPAAAAVPEQLVLKYATILPALREMGYVAVGVGKAEFRNGLFQLLEEYAGQKEQPPYTLAGNVAGLLGGKLTPREVAFPGPGQRAMVGLVEVAEIGSVPVGIAGVVGPSVQKAVADMGSKTLIGFTPEKDALSEATKIFAAHPRKPTLTLLLYQGTLNEARAVAKQWPQFRIIVCLSDDAEPPETPDILTRAGAPDALILRVGHKGRYVGVVGAFQNSRGDFDLKYQIVPLGEEFNTPGTDEVASRTNPALARLDQYAEKVKSRNLLAKFPAGPHPAQVALPQKNVTFVGSEACKGCHAAEYTKWSESHHAHAFDALTTIAKRPALRHFDGECVVCHTVGFGYKGGYRNELATPGLKHVGCEACHGPGSAHAADPKDAKLLALQSPWRRQASDRLPDATTLEKLANRPAAERNQFLTAAQLRAINGVAQMCMACHDSENDPNFDLFTYWPKVVHPTAKK
ncbi:MAG: multiheme c-type cytochrome [Gemmataceae bacterium]|nr:hypothetical protein [Gemmata sp.]MDW8199189.1 multiheme c-type cytochrome [Gemmataceae bacterium]